MKKFAMAAVAAAAMMAGGAQAYTVGTFTGGFVVPNVVHDASGTTAVGIISKGAGCVNWTFFDENSEHVTDGRFYMTHNDYSSFVWSAQSGANLSGKRGYLVFAAGEGSPAGCLPDGGYTGMAIGGNAFHVMPGSSDVAFVPVIDGVDTTGIPNLNDMDKNSINVVTGAAQLTAANTVEFSMRYYIDGKAGGNDTHLVIWSTGVQKGAHTMFMYDDAQHPKSVTVRLANEEQDTLNVEGIQGRPETYTDGFITWTPRRTVFGGTQTTVSIFTYSLINAPAFGAVQTMLGAHVGGN